MHIPAAQAFKIASGLAQVVFAAWLMIRGPRNRVNMAFAIAFSANGAAYAIFNLAPPGQRTQGSFVLEGRGAFNWIAVFAMVLFALFLLQMVQRRKSIWMIALVAIALPMLASDIAEARERGIGLLAFGGTAIYPATAFTLALLALAFARNPEAEVRTRCALLGAALAINSVDHLGAGIIQPSPYSLTNLFVRIGAMSIILGLWLWNARGQKSEEARLSLAVVFCMVAPFLAGILVRLAAGSYRVVQESGFIGAGRFATTGLLIYGMLRRELFAWRGESIAPGYAGR